MPFVYGLTVNRLPGFMAEPFCDFGAPTKGGEKISMSHAADNPNILRTSQGPFFGPPNPLIRRYFGMPKKRTPMSEAVGRRLKALRLAKGYDKIRHFAEDLDVNEDRYDKWEKGKALIPADEALKLKRKFGITSDWLYFGDEAALPNNVHSELRKTGT